MEGVLKGTAALITLSVLSLAAVFLYVGSNDINMHAIAQQTTPVPLPNDTETIQGLDELLGNNTAVIFNDTSISNPNNTVADSITVNLKEDCMKLPNTDHYYCP